MITEDYVSFETAKLLKVRGFDGIVTNSYDNYTLEFLPHCAKYYGQTNAPTLQMAMKWLREEHRIFLNISYIPEHFAFSYGVISPLGETKFVTYVDTYVDTYEQACEAAIKYCLENLI